MAVLKYTDPVTGEVKKIGLPASDSYNKNEQLSNETKALLGLSEDATPDDVVRWLAENAGSTEVHIGDTPPEDDSIIWINTGDEGLGKEYYDKDETLSSATKTALGLGENATPNDAFGILMNRSGGSEGDGGYVETDPTVPSWAKAAKKPTYTASEVGARSDTWIPTAAEVGARPADWLPTPNDISAYSLKNATDITQDADLNNYAEFGNYVASSTVAATLLNCPVTAGFVMHVERSAYGTNSKYCKQRIICYDNSTEWWRSKVNDTWTNWVNTAACTSDNLLNNWYFLDPVNSRGQTSYTGTFCIDGWYGSDRLSVELTANGVKIIADSTGAGYFRQFTENGYPNGTYTLSLLVTDVVLPTDTTTHHVVYFAKPDGKALNQLVRNLDAPGLYTFTNTATADDFTRVQFDIRAGGSVTIASIKLEYGNIQTLAQKDSAGNWVIGDVPPNKDMELLKCIQYKPTTNGTTNVSDEYAHHTIYSTLNKPTAEDVGARPSTWMPTAAEVKADPEGAASHLVLEHNGATGAHTDIRTSIDNLARRLNNLADSDDTTLDQLSEIVAYIKANKTLIESITTSKVNVSDIVNTLTSSETKKPLSAAQGKALKALIDAIKVPTKVSELTNDKNYLTSYTETDPTVPSWAKAAKKPTYTASEVGARSSTWMPTAAEVGARASDWMPTAAEVGALPVIYAGSADYDMDTIIQSGKHNAIYLTNTDTLGTPKAYGLSGFANAMIISYAGYISPKQGVQIAFENGGLSIYIRRLYNDTISDWQKLYTEANKPTPNDILAYSLVDAISIASGDDLNNYSEFGNYVCTSDVAASLLHCPTGNGFMLHVERASNSTTGSSYCKQRIVSFAGVSEWWRSKNSGTWSEWTNTTACTAENLLDNWYFLDPVNSRGETSYTGELSIDRWYGDSNLTMELTDKGLKITNIGTGNGYFTQYTDENYPNGRYIASVLVTEVTPATDETNRHLMYFARGNKRSGQYIGNLCYIDNPGVRYTTTNVTSGNFRRVEFIIKAGGSITIAAIKLERGRVQTLAQMNADGDWIVANNPPDKNMELLKCIQRKPTDGNVMITDEFTGHTIYSTLNKPSFDGADLEQWMPNANDILAYSLKDATAISSTADNPVDLNNYTTFGNYSATSAVAKTLLHCPITSGFVLHVERSATTLSGYCKQKIVPYDDVGEWWRVNSNGTWTNWINTAKCEHVNLLDNWYLLDPVNSRGETTYAGTYGIDRWYGSNNLSMEVTENGLKISCTSESSAGYFRQYTEKDFPDDKYTVSLLVTEVTLPTDTTKNNIVHFANGSGSTVGTTKYISSTGLHTLTVNTASYEKVFNRIQFTINPGGSITIAAIKLERGSVQTLAHMGSDGNWVINDTLPDKCIEQLKYIQRKPTSNGTTKLSDDMCHHEVYTTANKPTPDEIGAADITHQHTADNVKAADEVVTALGLPEGSTIDDALIALTESNAAVMDSVSGGCSIEYVNYIGDGKYGAANARTFTVGGKPLVVFISGEGDSVSKRIELFRGNTTGYFGTVTDGVSNVTWTDNSVTFYDTTSIEDQCNVLDKEYHATIIFKPNGYNKQVKMSVTLPDGSPAANVKVKGIYTQMGTSASTNINGVVTGYSETGETVIIEANDKYIDIQDMTFTMPTMTTDSVITLSKTLSSVAVGTVTILSRSQTVNIAGNHTVNMSIVGGGTGGQGGEAGYWWDDPDSYTYETSGGRGGAGGASGKVLNKTNYTLSSGTRTLIVGSGGQGGAGATENEENIGEDPRISGTAGGYTTFGELSSNSGSASNTPVGSANVGGAGGAGGKGGGLYGSYTYGTAGAVGTRSGGTGGNGGYLKGSDGNVITLGSTSGAAGRLGGGGGGGGGGHYNTRDDIEAPGSAGGNGGNGCVVIEWLS